MTAMNYYNVINDYITKDRETFEIAQITAKNFEIVKQKILQERLQCLSKDILTEIKQIDTSFNDWVVTNDPDNANKKWKDFIRIGNKDWFQCENHFFIYLAFNQKDCKGCYLGICGNFKYDDNPFNTFNICQEFLKIEDTDNFRFGQMSPWAVSKYMYNEYKDEELYKKLYFDYQITSQNIINPIIQLIKIVEIQNNKLLTEINQKLATFQMS